MPIHAIEFVENPEPRCPVVLLLDTSDSMAGEPIEQLNEGIATFKYEVEKDTLAALRVEVCLITFGSDVTCVQDFTTIDDFTAPRLHPKGYSPLGGALELGLEKVLNRVATYKNNGIPYYRPWIFLITDGAPTDGMKWYEAGQEAQALERRGLLNMFLIGVEGADMAVLSKIASPDRPPLKLQALKFNALFRWLSSSVRRVSSSTVASSDMITLPSVAGWAHADTTYDDG